MLECCLQRSLEIKKESARKIEKDQKLISIDEEITQLNLKKSIE